MEVQGRTVLITGAGRGIGLEIASLFVSRGARVVALEANEDLARAGKDELGEADWIAQDLGEPGAATSALSAAMNKVRKIDILVLNAAIQRRQSPSLVSRDAFIEQVDVNLYSNLGLLQGCLPQMAENGWGRIVTIGSIQQIRPNPALAVYAATKSALKTLALAMTRPHFSQGVTVNNISPGLIDTPRNWDLKSDRTAYEAVVAAIPAGREGTPRDVALAALFLCSEAASYILGADLPVDGGAHIPA